jgi:transcriptional regulator with XRE-family HTH domain
MSNKLHPLPNENSWRVLVLLLKQVAQEKGITQGEIAEALGLTQSNVSRIFSTKYVPSLKVYNDITTVLGLKVFFEDTSGKIDLDKLIKKAMTELGRRPENLPKN